MLVWSLKMQESLESKKKGRLSDCLNLLDIAADGMVYGLGGETAFIYEINPTLDILLEDRAGQDHYLHQAKTLLGQLAPGMTVTFVVHQQEGSGELISRLKEKASSLNGAVKGILDSRIKHLQNSPGLIRKGYLILSNLQRDFLNLDGLPAAFFRRKAVLEDMETRIKGLREELLIAEANILPLLESLKVKARRLTYEEALTYYFCHLNPQRARDQKKPQLLIPAASLRSQLCLSPAALRENHIWVDGQCFAGISLFTFPEELYLGKLDHLISKLPPDSRFVGTFLGVNQERILDGLKNEERKYLNLLGLSRNHEAKLRSSETEELITLTREKGEKLLFFSGFVLVCAKSEEEIRGQIAQASSAIRECLGTELIIENFEHLRMFLSALPISQTEALRSRRVTSAMGACLAPLSAPWEGTESLGMILESANGNVVSVDPFAEGIPRHGMVIGTTGSGKSFAMNYLIMSLYATDERTSFVVIDIGGSYKRLCEVLGGDYFEVKLAQEFAMNPFPQKEAMLDDKGEMDSDLLGYLRVFIQKMLGRPLGPVEKRLIEAALQRLYLENDMDEPTLGGFIEVLAGLQSKGGEGEAIVGLANELRFYTETSYGKLLNAKNQIQPFTKRLTVFDLANLKQHADIQTLLTFMISFGLARSLKDKSLKKVIVIDEGWEFFNDQEGSDLIARLYRSARKFNAMILTASQNPEDFRKSKASSAMIANSDIKIFLRLPMGHEMLPAFGLNPAQVEAVKTLGGKARSYSEMLLVFKDKSRVLRLAPTSLEYRVATTNAQECVREEALRIQKNGIERLDLLGELARLEPVGV